MTPRRFGSRFNARARIMTVVHMVANTTAGQSVPLYWREVATAGQPVRNAGQSVRRRM